METITTKLIIAGILGILTLISGVVLSNTGRPLNSVIFNLHKLIAVAMIVLIVISVVQLAKAGETKALIELIAIVITGALFLALVATGGMLSFERQWPALVLKIHQIVPLLSLASAALTVFLLSRGQA
jgi:hypothetical protein